MLLEKLAFNIAPHLIGAGVGAGAGAAVDKNKVRGALIGAGVGAGAGHGVSKLMAKKPAIAEVVKKVEPKNPVAGEKGVQKSPVSEKHYKDSGRPEKAKRVAEVRLRKADKDAAKEVVQEKRTAVFKQAQDPHEYYFKKFHGNKSDIQRDKPLLLEDKSKVK